MADTETATAAAPSAAETAQQVVAASEATAATQVGQAAEVTPQGIALVNTETPAPAEVKAIWPDDWRQRMAGTEDEKELKQLGRYGSPQDVWRKTKALEAKMSSGELKPTLGKDATPEQLTAWREANGIPEAPDKYDLAGIQIDDPDRALVGEVLRAAHGVNLTPDQAKAIVSVWPAIKMQAFEARATLDKQAQVTAEDALRAEWGADYTRHKNLVTSLFDKVAVPGLADNFWGGRLADGTPIGSSPAAMKMMLQLALVDNPVGVIVPNAGGDHLANVDDEIGKIEKVMRENRQVYNKDEKMQERYRSLIEARMTLKARG